MIQRARILVTRQVDPHKNLALEEALLRTAPPGLATLFLWQNRHTVVIGAGQNAWRECNTALLEREGGTLARRSSGGGAVYHDMGNLNFSFLVPRQDYDLARQQKVVLDAVRSLGIQAQPTGRNDLTVEGRKFSGNAFRLLKDSALHHGTLLVSADMGLVARYLNVDPAKLQAKGVQSVKSRVANLCEYRSLTIDQVVQAMEEAFRAEYGPCIPAWADGLDIPGLDQLTARYQSWEWNYGQSPAGDWHVERRFPWGGIELFAHIERGCMRQVRAYTDAMDETLGPRLAQVLESCPFQPEPLAQRLHALDLPELAQWLAQVFP